jgi:response regulator RpfG family c-di-GMP phosphodiesterase
VILPAAEGSLTEPFDLAIVDGAAIELWGYELQAAKHAAAPVFLPYLLLAPHQQPQFVGRHLGQTADELLRTPIDPAELRTRVALLLRMRYLSHALQQYHDELEALLGTRRGVE